MKNTRFMLATKENLKDLLSGAIHSNFETLDASLIINQTYLKKVLDKIDKLENFLIDNKYYCIVYFAPSLSNFEVTSFGSSKRIYKKGWDGSTMDVKICTIYDKNLKFIKKGTLANTAKFLGIIKDSGYEDVSNIENNPELFLKIYKTYMPHSPQEIADIVLRDCKNGEQYAQFLVKDKNPILKVCEKEGISRRELAGKIGISVQNIEQCLSRGKCSKNVVEKLREVYKYV